MRGNLLLTNRIKRISIRNVGSLGDVTVELEDLIVLVGGNGTGKSNFLNALRFTRDVISEGLGFALLHQAIFVQRQDITDPKQVSDVEIEIRLMVDQQEAFFSFAYGKDTEYGLALKHEVAQIGDYKYKTNETLSAVIFSSPHVEHSETITLALAKHNAYLLLTISNMLPNLKPFIPLFEFLANLRVYSIFPDTLRNLNPPGQRHLFLEENGQNLSRVLQDFENSTDSKRKQDFYDELERISPGIDTANPITVTEIGGYLVVTINHSDARGTLNLSAESDGTLRALALLMALNQTPGPSIIGIEEPELMIHPGAMGILANVIRGTSHRSQVILTTHSPDLITNFPVNSLRIVDLENGATKIGPVREDERQIVEDKLFKAGDLLRLGGLERE